MGRKTDAVIRGHRHGSKVGGGVVDDIVVMGVQTQSVGWCAGMVLMRWKYAH